MRFIIPMIVVGLAISGCGRNDPPGRAGKPEKKLAGTQEGQVPGLGIAIVDSGSVFKSYKKSKSISDGLEKEKRNLESRGQKMLDEINALVKESELLSEGARKEREALIKEKSMALEVFQRDAAKNLAERTNDEYEKLMHDVRAAAEAVGQRRGIKVIIDSSTVVYGATVLDVTGEIIDELNGRFDKESGKK